MSDYEFLRRRPCEFAKQGMVRALYGGLHSNRQHVREKLARDLVRRGTLDQATADDFVARGRVEYDGTDMQVWLEKTGNAERDAYAFLIVELLTREGAP